MTMDENKVQICGMAFISGWIMFFGSAIFEEILRVNHSNINGLNLDPLYHIIGPLTYLGLAFVIVSAILLIRFFRNN